MRPSRIARIIHLGSFLGAAALASGQSTERPPCGAEPRPESRCRPGAAPNVLATVGGRPVTLDDLDGNERAEVAAVDAEIARARKEALEEEIGDRLLDAEARKLRTTPDRLYFSEVVLRVAPATEAEIQAEYGARADLRAASSLEDARDWLAGTLWSRREAELFERWAAAARARTKVTYGPDVNAPGLRPGTVVAVVGAKPVDLAGLQERLAVKRDEVERRVYARERAAVVRVVHERLVQDEAVRRNTNPADILRSDLTEKIRPASEEDVAAFYEQHRTEFDGDLGASRTEIADFLNRDRREEAERLFYARLAEEAGVRLSVPEPAPLTLALPTTDAPGRGPATAPVTIVEFADFECGACGGLYPELEGVLQTYRGRVRLVFRNFPLTMHPHAFRAAEAAVAARSQEKFWEFADRLFRNQRALDEASLRGHAARTGLDMERFDRALEGRKGGPAVVHDIRLGRKYGVQWTPVVFVNGVRLQGELRPAIDAALAQAARARRSP